MFSWEVFHSFFDIVVLVGILSVAIVAIVYINKKWPKMKMFWPLLCVSTVLHDDPFVCILFSVGITELIHALEGMDTAVIAQKGPQSGRKDVDE